jgi:hypothetical protein
VSTVPIVVHIYSASKDIIMQLTQLHEAWDWKKFGKGAATGAAMTASALAAGNLIDNHRPSVNQAIHADSHPQRGEVKPEIPPMMMSASQEAPKPAPPKPATPKPAVATTASPAKPPAAHDSSAGLQKLYGSELPLIKSAADRNGCTGDLFNVLLAIRKAENGDKYQFGILKPGTEGLETQAAWCASTIVKNHARWLKAGSPGEFLNYLGDIYCPVGAANDPGNLNKNWKTNVSKWYRQIKHLQAT